MTAPRLPVEVSRGTRATLAAQVAAQLLALAVLAALYRLMAQADFGLLGMAMPVVLLLRTCLALGLSAATVQRRQLSDAQLGTIFWWQQAAGLATALATAALGPLLAWWYAAPQLSLVCVVLAGATPAAALGNLHLALLERNLRFGPLAIGRLVAQATGGAAGVGAAVAGWDVWALVLQQYVELLVLSASAWGLTRWRPAWPWRCEKVPGLARFGGYFSLSNLANTVALTADKVLLSVFLGGTESGRAMIGMYSQAFNLMIKPVYVVTTPISAVALPSLSRASGNSASYAVQTGSFFRLTAILLFPCGVGLWITARDAILVLGGENWRDAGVLLEALAPAILAHGFLSLCTFVLTSADQPGRLLAASLLKMLLFAQGYAVGYYLGGQYLEPPFGPALGVAVSHSLIAVAALGLPYSAFSMQSAGVSPWPVFASLGRPLFAALLMGLLTWSLRGVLLTAAFIPPGARLAILIAVGAAVYALVARREVKWLLAELSHF